MQRSAQWLTCWCAVVAGAPQQSLDDGTCGRVFLRAPRAEQSHDHEHQGPTYEADGSAQLVRDGDCRAQAGPANALLALTRRINSSRGMYGAFVTDTRRRAY